MDMCAEGVGFGASAHFFRAVKFLSAHHRATGALNFSRSSGGREKKP